jgi:hypothetical protein
MKKLTVTTAIRAAAVAVIGAAAVIAGVLHQADDAAAATDPNTGRTIALCTFFNSARGDYFTTSDPRWCRFPMDYSGSILSRTVDGVKYQYVRTEGEVFDPAGATPVNGKMLFQWWSPSRQDNFLTSDSRWDPSLVGTAKAGYYFVRHEGFVLNADTVLSNCRKTVALRGHWNPRIYGPNPIIGAIAFEDNYATTVPLTDFLRTLGYAPYTPPSDLQGFIIGGDDAEPGCGLI